MVVTEQWHREAKATERRVLLLTLPKTRGARHTVQDYEGWGTRFCSGGRSRNKGKTWAGFFIGTFMGKARQGRESTLGSATLNCFNQSWGIGAVPSHWVAGPWLI